MESPARDLALALRLAWLLRTDVRAGADLDDAPAQKAFTAWWALFGRREFSDVLPSDARVRAVLAEVVASPASPDDPFPLTRLMDAVWRCRCDIHARFPYRDPAVQAGFVDWFFVYGVAEYDLFGWLDRDLLQRLAGPVTPEWPEISRLLCAVWRTRPDLQAAFDLSRPADRLAFAGWYVCVGIDELGHGPYAGAMGLSDRLAAAHPRGGDLSWLEVLAFAYYDRGRLADRPDPLPKAAVIRHWRDKKSRDRIPRHRLSPDRAPAARGRVSVADRPFGVNIVGFARGEFGVAEESRMAAAALEAAGIPYAVVPIPAGRDVLQADHLLDPLHDASAPYRVNQLCLTGFDTAHVWLSRGEALFADRINIGCWHWELALWPPAWEAAFALVDEVWAASHYTAAAFAARGKVPITFLPPAVSVDRLRPQPRSRFGLPRDRFLYLYVFDCNSYPARKNPWAAVRGFLAAFPRGDEPVGLVLKAMHARDDDPAWRTIRELVAADARVFLIEGTLPREEVLGLFAACDAYLSPHRAEGFGRTLAEAMLLEKPVIATDYSGNTDFLTEATGFPVRWRPLTVGADEYPCPENQFWADPDPADLVRQIRLVREAPDLARQRAAAGARHIREHYAPAVVGAAYARRLEALIALFAAAPSS